MRSLRSIRASAPGPLPAVLPAALAAEDARIAAVAAYIAAPAEAGYLQWVRDEAALQGPGSLAIVLASLA